LRALDLTDNDIAVVPATLGLAQNLASLVLHGNPQRTVRVADLPAGTQKLLATLRGRLPPEVGADEESPHDDATTIDIRGRHRQSSSRRQPSVSISTSHRRGRTDRRKDTDDTSPPPPDSPPPPTSPPPPPWTNGFY